MTFFYDLNKKLDTIREKPELKHGQLNERASTKPVEEGMEQLVQRIGGIARKAKKVGGKVLDTLGHGSDTDMIKDLQRKAGVPQTGKKPQQPVAEEGGAPVTPKQKSFAALAEPKDKITFADKIAGAKKEVDEMLGDVAAEAIRGALSPKQKKLDKNNNGKLDANDFAMLRKGAKGKQETDEGSTGDYSAKKARAGKDIGKPGKAFGKIAKGAAERYGSKAAGKRVAGAVLNKLRHPGELEENAAAGYDPETQARIKAANPQQLAQMAQEFAGGPAQYQSELKMLQQAKAELSGQMEEGWDDMLKDVEKRRGAMKTGEKIKGHKGEIEKTATGIKHTRSYDEKTGETDSDDTPAGEKRGRGRPKGTGGPRQERATAKSRKSDRTAHGQAGFAKAKKTNEGENQSDDVKQAMAVLKKAGYKVSKAADGAEELDEKAVSKKQQRFMGMVHATQKGEKAPSKEVAKVAKTMKKSDAEDFASTKHKGLPEKKKSEGKKEKTTEAGGTGTPTASSGFSFGKGIYDSMNHELETMIAESMNVSMNMNTDANGGPSKSLTITATDEDALKLGALLKNAGLGDGSNVGGDDIADEIRTAIDSDDSHGEESCPSCGSADCGCEEVDEAYGDNAVSQNEPNWPTNQEAAQDNLEYSGGLNKPKASGMATIPVTDVAIDGEDKFSSAARLGEDAELARMKEMAGIKEAKKVDEDDVEEGNKFTGNLAKARADGKKEADLDGDGDLEKVKESIFTLTNQWKAYKG